MIARLGRGVRGPNEDGDLVVASARPAVDVGVVTWNTAEVTAGALRRLLEGEQGSDLRLLVHDNASSDRTVGTLADRVPEAEVEMGTSNVGFAAAVNKLLARSRAPWFFLLNPDAWPEAGAVSTLVRTAEQHPRAAAVVPRLENPDGSLQHSTYPFPSIRVAAATVLGPRLIGSTRAERLMLTGAWAHDRARKVDWAIGAAMLMRRDAVLEIGGFDERFFMYVEDLEWCWRAHKRGWEIWFEPSAIVKHIGNVSGKIGYGDHRTAAYMRNTYRFYRDERGALRAALYRGLNLTGAGLRYLRARRSGDEEARHYWRLQFRSHMPRRGHGDRQPREPAV